MKTEYKKPDTSISIEEMRPGDVADVKAIEREVNLSSWSTEDYINELERADSVCLAAKQRGKVIGFAVTRLITLTDITLQQNEAELLNIAVTESLQHQSIGTKLLTALTENLKSNNIFCIWLEVRKSNTPALNFYAKHGFRKRFRRRDYYSLPREDALVMCREIGCENPEQTP